MPSDVDVLIGAEKIWELLDIENIQLSCGPYFQSSKLGWLMPGSTRSDTMSYAVQWNVINTCGLDTMYE